jgi:hypothetical protein
MTSKPVWMNSHAFRSGDQVLAQGELAIIQSVFPDGIHMVSFGNGKVSAVTASALAPAPPWSGPRSATAQIAAN